MGFDRIPDELKSYEQFLVWRYEENDGDRLTKVPYNPVTGQLASVTDPSTWATFDYCVAVLQNTTWYSGLGFVFTENDPYAFVDLDDPKGDQAALDKQINIFNDIDGYAELSPSGKGLHIIVKGSLPTGRRRGKIEIYSSARYATMTGQVYRDAPIYDQHDKLNALYSQLSVGTSADAFYAGLEDAKLTDDQVIEIAGRAQNAEKFSDLFYEGNWGKYYPSQSEADFALFDILAFYSENGLQTQRLFLQSALGQREKSRAQYRLNYMLNRCFDRMMPPVDYEALREKIEQTIANNASADRAQAVTGELSPHVIESTIPPPPGLVGEIAQFIYDQSPRQAPEIALAGALAIMAGVCGKAYNINGLGLNSYFVLLAQTGTGKDAVIKGATKLFRQIKNSVPASSEFVGPSRIASAEALVKYMAKTSSCFFSMFDEFSVFFDEMGNKNASPHMRALKGLFLMLYSMSGKGGELAPAIWSDKDKNTDTLLSPAFSHIGVCTPAKFYEGLHEGMLAEGLLPRYTVIHYKGKRNPLNENADKVMPSFQLTERFSSLCANCLSLGNQNKFCDVATDIEALEILKQYDRRQDDAINNSDSAVVKDLLTRTYVNVLKIAALVAVGCNPYNPVIDKHTAEWAIALVDQSTTSIINKFESGDVGFHGDENIQLKKIVALIKQYVISPYDKIEKYLPTNGKLLWEQKLIPYSYVQKKLSSTNAFKNDRNGPTLAIKKALKTLCDRGDLQEVSKGTLSKDFQTSALVYGIVNQKLL